MSNIQDSKVYQTIARYMLPDVFPLVLDIERSKGNYLYDASRDRYYLDCFSYIASNPVGHNHPKLFESAFERKLLRAARCKPSNSDIYCAEMADFVETFARVAMPKEMQHLFCVSGGTLAVENAMKAAFDWKVRLNMSRGETSELGQQIIHFRHAFHGRSGYCLSVTNTADPRKTKFFPKFSWPRIVNPIANDSSAEGIERSIELEKQAVAEMKAAFAEHPGDIAAILIEPIQGEGGDNHFRAEFHQQLRILANENDALLIYDEVQSGLGLTGKMWAYQHYGMVPDIISFGKKTQVCGILSGTRIEEVENHVFKEVSRLNSTWGGSLVDMVRCQRYLEIIEEDKLVENAASVGEYFLSRLCELSATSAGILENPRGKGLMLAVDLPSPELRDELMRKTFEHGAMVIKCGTRTLRFRPSLTFGNEEVDKLLDILAECVAEVGQ